MKIGINTRYIQNRQTGIENYTLNLLLNLKKVDKDNEYVLFFGSDKAVPLEITECGFNYDVCKIPTRNQLTKVIWSHFYLPLQIKRLKLDLFHEPLFIAPIFKSSPTVVTVYDLAFIHVPDCFPYRAKFYFKALLAKSLKSSDRVIAISVSTKNDIVENFGISPNKIDIVYPGIDEAFKLIGDKEILEAVRVKYGLDDFVLAVSLISPRKNIIRLIKAFGLLKAEGGGNHKLVIVGGNGWGYEEAHLQVRRSGLEGEVKFLGYVPKKDLVCLYNLAKAFVYPSLYEGFGMPVLEAMACGCPVAASNVSSVPEACGDAALFFDPYSIEGISSVTSRLLRENDLRHKCIQNGFKQIGKFSWKKAAETTVNIYKNTCNFRV